MKIREFDYSKIFKNWTRVSIKLEKVMRMSFSVVSKVVFISKYVTVTSG